VNVSALKTPTWIDNPGYWTSCANVDEQKGIVIVEAYDTLESSQAKLHCRSKNE